MSRSVKLLFRELRWEIFKIILLDSILDSAVFFFLTHMVMAFFKLPITVSAILASLFFAINAYRRMKTVKLQDIEDKNPSIQEILRTANDNIDEDNFVAMALFEDLIRRIKNVSSGTMMQHGLVLTKMVAIFTLGFVMIIISANNITIDIVDIPSLEKSFASPKSAAMDIFGIDFNESEDIYGDAHIAKLGNEEVTLNLNPSISEVSLSEVKELEELEFEESRFPREIKAISDSPSDEKAPEEADIAIAYNLKLKEVS